MSKYRSYISKCENDYIEVEAEDADEAWDKIILLVPRGWELEDATPEKVTE